MKAELTEERVREIIYEIVWPDRSPEMVRLNRAITQSMREEQEQAIRREFAEFELAHERKLTTRLKRLWERRATKEP